MKNVQSNSPVNDGIILKSAVHRISLKKTYITEPKCWVTYFRKRKSGEKHFGLINSLPSHIADKYKVHVEMNQMKASMNLKESKFWVLLAR